MAGVVIIIIEQASLNHRLIFPEGAGSGVSFLGWKANMGP